MSPIRIQAPARLHFGLLGWGPEAVRQFGGLGLMIQSPNFKITAELAETDSIFSGDAEMKSSIARLSRIRNHAKGIGLDLPPIQLRIESDLPPHHGLGSGTQTTLALAEAALILAGCDSPSKDEVISAAGRYPRSGIGTHGYFSGGLIVDEGHAAGAATPKAPARLDRRANWPLGWQVVTVFPRENAGPSGARETAAFETLPNPPSREMHQVSNLVRNVLLPAVEAGDPDFDTAMDSLETVQATIGKWFAPAQGGHVYGSAERDRIVAKLKSLGLRGLGQSSWGPTLFGFARADNTVLEARLADAFGTGRNASETCRWRITRAENHGRRILREP